MPHTIPPEIALRHRLKDAIQHALELNQQLEAVISVKSKQPSGVFHGKIDHSQPPWAASVAHCVMDLHADARRMESQARAELNLPDRPRGGSGKNTAQALSSLVQLAVSIDDYSVNEFSKLLGRWARRAMIALGQSEPLRRIPRLPGEAEPACPWCENHTLRMFPMAGLIKCVTPKCADEQGRKPSARMEFSPHVGDFVLVWQDQNGVHDC